MQVTSLTAYQPQTVPFIFGIGLFSMSFEWSDDSNKGNMVAPYFALFSSSQSVVHKLTLQSLVQESVSLQCTGDSGYSYLCPSALDNRCSAMKRSWAFMRCHFLSFFTSNAVFFCPSLWSGCKSMRMMLVLVSSAWPECVRMSMC